MELNFGTIEIRKKINLGNASMGIKKIYPPLEDIEITPTNEEQVFESEVYGFKKIRVKKVEGEELTIIPSAEEQVNEGLFEKVVTKPIESTELILVPSTENQINEGLYNKVTVEGDSNFIESNIRSGVTMWGKTGIMEAAWDTKQIRQCYAMFKNNTEMIEAPYFDTSNVEETRDMFYGCTKASKIPSYDFTNVTSTYNMCYGCTSLLETPKLRNTNKVTTVNTMYMNCYNLKTVSPMDTSNVTNMYGFYGNDYAITTAPEFNAGKVTNINAALNSTELITFGGFKDLGKAYTQKTANYSNYTLNMSRCSKMTHESLMNVINGLYDLNLTYDVANGGTLYTQTLRIGPDNIAKLTAAEIRNCY